MKKNKTLNIVLICLVATAAVAFGICKLVIPEQTQLFLDWAWVNLNKPLPVVGVSAIALGIILWRLFASTSFGKEKINELKEKYLNLVDSYEQFKNQTEIEKSLMEMKIEELKQELDNVHKYVDNIKLANPCKKVREIKYERKEETHD